MPPCVDCALVWSSGMTLPLAPAAAPAACSTVACAIWPRGGSAWCGRRASRKESCITLAGHGATVMNYLKFKNASHATDGPGWVCELEDQLSQAVHQARANVVVNATGPWADGLPHSKVKLRLTKGIHLVTERKRLPLPEAMVITQGKRILFVIPWGERLIIGTTDTDYQGSLDDVRAEPQDIAYLLRALAEFFPSAALSEADIIATWAGLRPLLADRAGAGGPSDISRAHQIRTPEPGWWDVAGGKLTTYRLIVGLAGQQKS